MLKLEVWHVTPALRRLRWEDCELQTSLGSQQDPVSKNKTNKNKNQVLPSVVVHACSPRED
jgi:hypothetical protein